LASPSQRRHLGAARLTLTLATTAAATWCYLIGESVGSYLGFIKGGLALGAGCMIGMLLVLLTAGPTCVRFGIDSTIYVDAPEQSYYFWRGINPAAMIALAAGCCTYIALLNPLTYDSTEFYPYLTASLPSAVAAACVYFLCSLLVMRAGRGGYRKG
jgi:cytosine/uracil/thiamine/allantoin permease